MAIGPKRVESAQAFPRLFDLAVSRLVVQISFPGLSLLEGIAIAYVMILAT